MSNFAEVGDDRKGLAQEPGDRRYRSTTQPPQRDPEISTPATRAADEVIRHVKLADLELSYAEDACEGLDSQDRLHMLGVIERARKEDLEPLRHYAQVARLDAEILAGASPDIEGGIHEPGAARLLPGMIVMIHHDPSTCRASEGRAELLERVSEPYIDPDRGAGLWRVRFLAAAPGEPDVDRAIHDVDAALRGGES